MKKIIIMAGVLTAGIMSANNNLPISENEIWAGFCYIETWTNGDYASNSGLIVSPRYRNIGLASRIKESVFNVTREKYPNAKLFGITP